MFLEHTPVRLSKWSFVFQKESFEDIALYHSLNVDVVFLERHFEKMIDLLKLGTTLDFLIQKHYQGKKEMLQEVLEELYSMGLIVECDSNDMDLLEKKKDEYIKPVGMETLYLMLTDQCNLKCAYCFINNNMPVDYECKNMSFDTAKKAIDIYFSNISKNPEVFDNALKMIFFYGGEPFLNFETMKKSVTYIEDRYKKEIKEMGNKFRLSVVTNGTLINEEMAKFLAEHENISIGISLDGDGNVNDKKRKFQDGTGAFSGTIKAIKLLNKVGRDNISLSCTVDNHNINELESLLRLNDEYEFVAINMNILLDTERDMVNHEYMEKVSKKILDYFELAREKGLYEDRIMRKLKAFISNKIHPFDCQATGNQIVCSPDGKFGVCHEGIGAKNFFFSDVSKDLDFHNNPLIKDWNIRSPLNMPQCFDCSALGLCGGGCAYGAWLRSGSIWSMDDRFCVHSLTTLEWLIWDLYKQFSKSSS